MSIDPGKRAYGRKARKILAYFFSLPDPTVSVTVTELGKACDSASGAVAAITLPLRDDGMLIRVFGTQRIGTTYRLNPERIDEARARAKGPVVVSPAGSNWVPPLRLPSIWAYADNIRRQHHAAE